MASQQDLIVEKERGRARIIFNRPERHNAVGGRMASALHEALWDADQDDEVHAVVIKGNGPSFCAGADLRGYEQSPERKGREGTHYIDDDIWQIERGQRQNLAIFDMHKPVIAQVHGHCLALGTVIAFYCDMVICADDARLGFPPSRNLGTTPSMMWLHHAGPQWAKRLLMTGDTISGAEAAQIGLALKAVPLDLLEAEVEGLLDRLALIDHHLLAANKRVVNLGLELMGARTLQRVSAEIDARAHLAPGARTYYEDVKKMGLTRALKHRDAPFGDGRARVSGPEIRDENSRLIEP
jgi:enoyl-CoA hydratase